VDAALTVYAAVLGAWGAPDLHDEAGQLSAVRSILQSLPTANYSVLKYFFMHLTRYGGRACVLAAVATDLARSPLARCLRRGTLSGATRVAAHSHANQMEPRAIATCVAPNLMRPEQEILDSIELQNAMAKQVRGRTAFKPVALDPYADGRAQALARGARRTEWSRGKDHCAL